MPNYCDYEMKVKGSKEAIKELLECLNADYNYSSGAKPEHKHMFRVFQAELVNDRPKANIDGTYTQHIYGYCAWSVASCMLRNRGYYADIKKEYPEIFMGTSLEELSKELDIEIEVFSEEPGMCFSEHYIFERGVCVCEECEELETVGVDEKGHFIKNVDWENYDGDTIELNPNRQSQTGQYLWTY